MYSRIWIIALCFLLALLSPYGCGGGKQVDVASGKEQVQQQATSNQTRILAVLPFDVVGESKLSGEEAMNLLIGELMDLEGFKIVDREALQQVLDQLGFGLSDLADRSNRTKVGNMLGAKILCIGSINKEFRLATARIDSTETGEVLLVVRARNKDEIENIEEIAQELKDRLPNVIPEEPSGEPGQPEVSPTVTVEVKGYGAIIDGDLIMAKELALKDAYSKAIEQGCGVKLVRTTQVENFQLVRDKILTESVGYVTSYEILNENDSSEFGYEVDVRANVSQEPISDIDKLQLMVKYLLAEPRIVVVMEGENASVIEGQISARLQKAGFLVVDAKTIEEKKQEFKDLLSKEDAARLGGMLDANVTVRGALSSTITGRVGDEFPIITARTTGAFEIVLAETAKVLSVFSHEDFPAEIGSANTEEEAIRRSVDNLIQPATDKLAWELASKLGEPIDLRLELRNATLDQAEQFQKQIEKMPKHIVLGVEMQNYQEGTADYQIKTSVRSQVLQQKLRKLLDPAPLGAREIVPGRISLGVISMSLEA